MACDLSRLSFPSDGEKWAHRGLVLAPKGGRHESPSSLEAHCQPVTGLTDLAARLNKALAKVKTVKDVTSFDQQLMLIDKQNPHRQGSGEGFRPKK
jgi:hypothetical protein